MSQVSGTIVPSWSSFVYGGEKVAAPRRAHCVALAEGVPHVQLRFTLFKSTTRHRPRLHHQARGTGVLRAMINPSPQGMARPLLTNLEHLFL